MNIFDLRQKLIADYSSYIRSFLQIRDPRIQEYVEQELFRDGVLWPQPLIQMNPMFQPGCTIDQLVDQEVLHPACAQIFRRGKEEKKPQGELLHLHQEKAIRVARGGHSYVLTTGTGSGKSLSYMIPIVDAVLRYPNTPGIQAIVMKCLKCYKKRERPAPFRAPGPLWQVSLPNKRTMIKKLT